MGKIEEVRDSVSDLLHNILELNVVFATDTLQSGFYFSGWWNLDDMEMTTVQISNVNNSNSPTIIYTDNKPVEFIEQVGVFTLSDSTLFQRPVYCVC